MSAHARSIILPHNVMMNSSRAFMLTEARPFTQNAVAEICRLHTLLWWQTMAIFVRLDDSVFWSQTEGEHELVKFRLVEHSVADIFKVENPVPTEPVFTEFMHSFDPTQDMPLIFMFFVIQTAIVGTFVDVLPRQWRRDYAAEVVRHYYEFIVKYFDKFPLLMDIYNRKTDVPLTPIDYLGDVSNRIFMKSDFWSELIKCSMDAKYHQMHPQQAIRQLIVRCGGL